MATPAINQNAYAAEARAALGQDASATALINYAAAAHPQSAYRDDKGNLLGIIGQASDPKSNFVITQPSNSDQMDTIHGWEFAIQHNSWETGFGTILNYTVVKSDHNIDNAIPHYVTQFAVPDASNSANADRRGHMRNALTVFFSAPGYARWAAGARVTF